VAECGVECKKRKDLTSKTCSSWGGVDETNGPWAKAERGKRKKPVARGREEKKTSENCKTQTDLHSGTNGGDLEVKLPRSAKERGVERRSEDFVMGGENHLWKGGLVPQEKEFWGRKRNVKRKKGGVLFC